MLEAQRLAADTVAAVLAGRSLNDALAAEFARRPRLQAGERGAAQDLCYGTLRFYGTLAAVLEALLKKPLSSDRLRALLLVALYQLEHTRAAPYAIVDHAVGAAARLGAPAAKGLVNAVLRNFLRDREGLLANARANDEGRYSHPRWWVERLRADYPLRYESILESANQRPPMTLRVNARRSCVADYLSELAAAGMEASTLGAAAIRLTRPVPVEALPGFGEGRVSVQDYGAQLAAPLLDPQPGMRVLDACAAPGGKAAHLLELADIRLAAVDVDASRLARVRDNLARLGLSAELRAGDAAQPAAWWDGAPFERILADVPCSASGVARRHPDVKWLRRESDIAGFAARQRAILEGLWQTLAKGGKLLYATCSVFREENQTLVAGFLHGHGDARRLPLSGIDAPDGQLLPDARHDGFFYALLEKA
ncbi:MAG: 16S rRNA (cytosine(967)-C(5))-methyltransferase RsmB [Betaproteobacteria bacterium]|nr:16S rRNA (cytosine(967)-C(5))-methyltransferase RsmB [Betaproteobacteria bacterium]